MKQEINVSSDITNIKDINLWIEKNLFINISNKTLQNNIRFVLQESFVNAVLHGNKSNISKKVLISFEIIENLLHLIIKDEGKGIKKTRQNMNFIEDKDILKESGKGIVLIKHFSNNVIFKKNSIEIILDLKNEKFK